MKLTPEEKLEADDYISSLTNKQFVHTLADTKDHLRTKAELEDFEQLYDDIEAAIVMKTVEGEEVKATSSDVEKLVRLDRGWTPQIIKDCLLKIRCPLDHHLYEDDYAN